MVVIKHLPVHGVKQRTALIKYILNPEKTKDLEFLSDHGMLNRLDWKIYEDYVDMYRWNFEINDERYQGTNDRLFDKQTEIHAHHVIQSFSPEDNLTPEEINRIGWETAKEFCGGRFRFIVATHVDQEHIHNHILINAIDLKSEKKFVWNQTRHRDLRQISDRISKVAGAKIIEPQKFSYSDYKHYKKSSHKYELKQRLNFLLKYSKTVDNFLQNAQALSVKIDLSGKHVTYFMTDREEMKKNIRADKINKQVVYDMDYLKQHFAKRDIQNRLEFLLKHSNSFDDLVIKAELLNLSLAPKTKKIDFMLMGDESQIVINSDDLNKKMTYDLAYFEDYFSNIELGNESSLAPDQVIEAYAQFEKFTDISIPTEDFLEQYHQTKEAEEERDLFEVELEDWQIEREVKDGLYIKVWFGLDSEGLVFIPNTHLEIDTKLDSEKRYRIFIDEKKYYYLYNKDNSENNRFVMGKTMIRQLSGERQKIPHRKFVTEKNLKEKMKQIDLLMKLQVKERSYDEIKQDLIEQIAQKELRLAELNQKSATLNQVAELLASCDSEDPDIQRRSRLELTKLNVSANLTYEQIMEQLREIQDDLYTAVGDYEAIIRQMETFIELLKKYNDDADKDRPDQNQSVEL